MALRQHLLMPPGGARALLGEVAELLFPQRCLVCGRFGAALHAPCIDALPRAVSAAATGARCGRCWGPARGAACPDCAGLSTLVALRAPFVFDGEARRALLEAKFRGRTALLPPLARAAAEAVPPSWVFDAVMPVPQDRVRARRRGFNPAADAAREVASALGAPYLGNALRRRAGGVRQATLDREQRMLAVRGAFDATAAAPARVLVVDDIATTGATLDACAQALVEAGAQAVYGLALARED